MKDKPGIIIIEDHPIVREGLAFYFRETGRWHISGKAADLNEAKEIFNNVPVDLALLDIQLEDGWGLDIIPWLKQKNKSPVTAVYSAYDDYAHVSAALNCGVSVYMCKRNSEVELEKALLKALNGETYIDNSVQIKLNNVAGLCSLLTKREAEILTMVKSGLSNKEIANRLRLNQRTIENILSCVYDKTGVSTRAKLLEL